MSSVNKLDRVMYVEFLEVHRGNELYIWKKHIFARIETFKKHFQWYLCCKEKEPEYPVTNTVIIFDKKMDTIPTKESIR